MTINMNNPKYFDPFLKNLEDNTDTNHHTSNALLVAVNFGNERQKKEMKLIYDNHNQLGHIDPITEIARDYLLKDILSNVKEYLKFHGVNKVHKGLARKIYKRL